MRAPSPALTSLTISSLAVRRINSGRSFCRNLLEVGHNILR
jgi:hypothetical protein